MSVRSHLDWMASVKLRSYDNKIDGVDVVMMYIWYTLGAFGFLVIPWVPLVGFLFMGMAFGTFFRMNGKARRMNTKYYRSWPYAQFLFRVKIDMILVRETYQLEVVEFCAKAYTTTKWFYNKDRLYLRNKRMLVAIKMRFPELVDEYVRSKHEK